MIDVKFFDGAAFVTSLALFWDWVTKNVGFMQDGVGFLLGVATLVYTCIRIGQALKGK